MVCDFERENHRFEICVCDFYVYVVIVFGFVFVCDFGLKNHKSKFLFLILGWAGHKRRGPTGRVWVTVAGPWVGFEFRKTQPKPDPLPFLTKYD